MITGPQIILVMDIAMRIGEMFQSLASIAQRVKAGEKITDDELIALAGKTDTSIAGFKAAGKHDRPDKEG